MWALWFQRCDFITMCNRDVLIYFFCSFKGIDETVKQVKSLGGRCNGYIVDISKKEEVYKAAEVIRKEIGNVSNIKFELLYSKLK